MGMTRKQSPSQKRRKPRSASKKAAKRTGRREVLMRVTPRPSRSRRAAAREVLGVRCRVLDVVPDAEAILLGEQVSGVQFSIPVPSRAKDGRFARDLVRLKGQDIWLSIRVMG